MDYDLLRTEQRRGSTNGVFISVTKEPQSACNTINYCLEEVIDSDQQWDVSRIIGKEDVDGVLHYWVAWCETLEPEHSLSVVRNLWLAEVCPVSPPASGLCARPAMMH